MLTWLFRLIWRWQRFAAEARDVYVSEATLLHVKRDGNLRKGSDR